MFGACKVEVRRKCVDELHTNWVNQGALAKLRESLDLPAQNGSKTTMTKGQGGLIHFVLHLLLLSLLF
jgi:hypothetical protein